MTTNNAIPTTIIRGGSVVLAKMTNFGLSAVKYTNATQAMKKAEELRMVGLTVEVFQPRTGPGSPEASRTRE
jgi:hypothetical protein